MSNFAKHYWFDHAVLDLSVLNITGLGMSNFISPKSNTSGRDHCLPALHI